MIDDKTKLDCDSQQETLQSDWRLPKSDRIDDHELENEMAESRSLPRLASPVRRPLFRS